MIILRTKIKNNFTRFFIVMLAFSIGMSSRTDFLGAIAAPLKSEEKTKTSPDTSFQPVLLAMKTATQIQAAFKLVKKSFDSADAETGFLPQACCVQPQISQNELLLSPADPPMRLAAFYHQRAPPIPSFNI
jgi:hypothetical protein